MAAYLEERHHPQEALTPRTLIVAESDGRIIGYVGGHCTQRFECGGELQYLFVAADYRRHGIGRELVRRLAHWFRGMDVQRVCANIDADSTEAAHFYSALGARSIRPAWAIWEDIGVLATG